jgi:hypothetical protein
MADNFNSEEFKHILREKELEIRIRTLNKIQESDNFKKLHRGLIGFYHSNAVNDFIAILISKPDIESFEFSSDLSIPLNGNVNYFVVDKKFDIVVSEKKELSDEIRAEVFYKELSKEFCVFLITPEGVNPFIDGENIGTLVFYHKKDFRAYKKLKDISQIDELFDKFRRHVTYRYNYTGFFVSKSAKKALYQHLVNSGENIGSKDDFVANNSQLLENKPEDRFRESLRAFLKENMKNDILFGKEYILENFNRLDINIFDDYGDLYFIEVKWVGKSINPDGDRILTEYTSNDINPAAVNQSIRYIKELFESKQNIKIGYLAVFDARYEEMQDTFSNFDEELIPPEDMKYYKLFKKIPDFRVVNSHPQ